MQLIANTVQLYKARVGLRSRSGENLRIRIQQKGPDPTRSESRIEKEFFPMLSGLFNHNFFKFTINFVNSLSNLNWQQILLTLLSIPLNFFYNTQEQRPSDNSKLLNPQVLGTYVFNPANPVSEGVLAHGEGAGEPVGSVAKHPTLRLGEFLQHSNHKLCN